jgi:hypothetical protein
MVDGINVSQVFPTSIIRAMAAASASETSAKFYQNTPLNNAEDNSPSSGL